jgi:deoxyribonuclease IV
MPRYLGAHMIDNGGIDMAALRAGNAGMKALQIFTAPPRFYGDRSGIKPERVERFKKALAQAGIEPRFVLVHGAYVLGVATPEDDKWIRAAQGLKKELERSTAIGVGSICFHPGSAFASPIEQATERVARAITEALQAIPGPTRVLVENTAGAGRTVGRTAEEIAMILSHVPAPLRARTGYGLDTCHLFSSGYDLGASKKAVSEILDKFEKIVGEPPRFFHLNDSEGPLGSNRDRHALIGKGLIGVEPFRALLSDPRSENVPLILETPQRDLEIAGDDPSPDPWDLEMMQLLTPMLN